eukprot:m.489489 g.489489  ORF g.489489 m.489489 type:complete len:326 (-) comp26809_c0_seq1:60-1037(-)
MPCVVQSLVALFSLSLVWPSTVAGAGDACNFGPTHHSHLVLPQADTLQGCLKPEARFVLSHGATFFCPHTFDVKLLATIDEPEAQATLCENHFHSIERGVSSKMVLRPTLPAGGLPKLARGEMTSWQSPVMYHVHNFGKDNDAGPDEGWNVTVVRNSTTTVHVQLIYGRQLDVEPRPASLTYLAHSAGEPGRAILSHYISTSGPSGFDQLLKADIVEAAATKQHRGGDEEANKARAIELRETWPTFVTIPARADDLKQRLMHGDDDVAGVLHTYDSKGMPLEQHVRLSVTLDYYAGTSDGFAGFGTMCPMKAPNPQSPSTCIPSH